MVIVEIYYNQANEDFAKANQILEQKHPQAYFGQNVMMPITDMNNYSIQERGESLYGQDKSGGSMTQGVQQPSYSINENYFNQNGQNSLVQKPNQPQENLESLLMGQPVAMHGMPPEQPP